MSDNEIRISNVLKELGIPCNIAGYHYIKLAIAKIMDSKINDKPLITKQIYPEVAFQYESTPSRVERAIRHAIDVAWSKGNVELLTKMFSYSISSYKGKATNAEFLFTVVEYLNLHPDKFCE